MGGRYDATNVFEPIASSSSSIPNHEHDDDHDTEHPTIISSTTSTSLESSPRILVRGVTLIDYDHTRILGTTLAQIAWEKGGIYVRNKLQCIGMDDGGYDGFVADKKCDATTTTADSVVVATASDNDGEDQPTNYLLSLPPTTTMMQPIVFVSGNNTSIEVLKVLDRIAKANGYQLHIVQDASIASFSEIGLQGEHQRSNAALAMAMCRYAMTQWQHSSSTSTTPSILKIQDALARTFWPGRCHTVPYPTIPPTMSDPKQRYNLNPTMNLRCDGAHTPLSMNACIEWFRKVIGNSGNSADASTITSQRKLLYLIFNCGHERNPIPLIYSLYTSNIRFESIYLCHADFERPSAIPKRLEEAWTMEPLVSKGWDGASEEAIVDLTFQHMCCKLLQAIATTNTTIADAAVPDGHNTSSANQDNGVAKLLSELSASSTSSWQETLANVWKVIDLYYRLLDNSAGSERPVKVVTGLNVSDALTSIQKEVTSTMKIGESEDGHDPESLVVEVCVTGSLYIVGSALAAAGWEEGKEVDSTSEAA